MENNSDEVKNMELNLLMNILTQDKPSELIRNNEE